MGPSWIVVGGETGPKARPMHPDWVRTIRDQCKAAGVPFWFKSWGEWSEELHSNKSRRAPVSHSSGCRMYRVGKARAGRLLDGEEHNEVPW